jgi:hypothetical protein
LPREISICSTTVCAGNLLHVGDLSEDERFRDNAQCRRSPAELTLNPVVHWRAICRARLISICVPYNSGRDTHRRTGIALGDLVRNPGDGS